jgi:hypothetical protein
MLCRSHERFYERCFCITTSKVIANTAAVWVTDVNVVRFCRAGMVCDHGLGRNHQRVPDVKMV